MDAFVHVMIFGPCSKNKKKSRNFFKQLQFNPKRLERKI